MSKKVRALFAEYQGSPQRSGSRTTPQGHSGTQQTGPKYAKDSRRIVVLSLPLSPDVLYPQLLIPQTLRRSEWRQLLRMLRAMRPALVFDPLPVDVGPGYIEGPSHDAA